MHDWRLARLKIQKRQEQQNWSFMMHTETSREGPMLSIVALISGHCKYTLSLSMDKMEYKLKFCNVNHVYQIIGGKKGEEGDYKENQNRREKKKRETRVKEEIMKEKRPFFFNRE